MFANLQSSGLKIFYEGATFNDDKCHYFFQMWGVFSILLNPYTSLAELVLAMFTPPHDSFCSQLLLLLASIPV